MLIRCGDDLFSVVAETPAEAQSLAAQLRRHANWLEVVPGIDTVMVRFDAARADATAAEAAIQAALEEGAATLWTSDELVEVPVVYGGEYGPDLEELSAATGLSADEIEQTLLAVDWGQLFVDRPPRRDRSMRRKEDDEATFFPLEFGLEGGWPATPRGLIAGQNEKNSRLISRIDQYASAMPNSSIVARLTTAIPSRS